MHDIDEMIVTTSKQLPAPAAGDQAASVLVVAVAPSWVTRRLGRFTTSASRNRGCRTPKGLTPAPDDARGRRGSSRGGLTVVGPGAAPQGGGTRPGPPPPP